MDPVDQDRVLDWTLCRPYEDGTLRLTARDYGEGGKRRAERRAALDCMRFCDGHSWSSAARGISMGL